MKHLYRDMVLITPTNPNSLENVARGLPHESQCPPGSPAPSGLYVLVIILYSHIILV